MSDLVTRSFQLYFSNLLNTFPLPSVPDSPLPSYICGMRGQRFHSPSGPPECKAESSKQRCTNVIRNGGSLLAIGTLAACVEGAAPSGSGEVAKKVWIFVLRWWPARRLLPISLIGVRRW